MTICERCCMEDSSQDIINQFFNGEIQYFYDHYADYDPNHIIEVRIAESIYEAALHLSIPDVQRETLMQQGKKVTDSLNGTVILLKDLEVDGLQIILSQHSFKYNDGGLTLIGTINHEFTHAIDFLDFAKHLGISDSEAVMRDDDWFTLQMWSEFHARRNGFLRVLDAATGGTLEYPDDYLEHELELIRSKWKTQRDSNELYELMQLCGRYAVLEELYPDRINGFYNDMLKGEYSGVKLYICNRIYDFCKNHKSFKEFINDKDDLKTLIS